MATREQEKVVMMDEPGLTERVTVDGWRGERGVVYNDERTARYSLCTHVHCSLCGAPTPKHYTKCGGCRDLADREKYDAMPKKAWDGVAMLYSKARDEYFQTLEDAEDCVEVAEGETLDDLMLVICEPNYARRLELDYFCDELAEDDEGPSELHEAIDAFNAIVEKAPPLSWSPGKNALLIESEPTTT